jgi:hypothetical protein
MPWKLSRTDGPKKMRNGIDYFFVEVTFGNGMQYGIPAYGEEARELRESAMALRSAGKGLLRPIVAH